jgi:hypothetical protein
MDTADLDLILTEIAGRIPTATEANQRSDGSVTHYAKSILVGLEKEINFKIERNEKNLVTDFRVSLDSPVLSLVVAALRKLGYNVRCDATQGGTQVSINWNI